MGPHDVPSSLPIVQADHSNLHPTSGVVRSLHLLHPQFPKVRHQALMATGESTTPALAVSTAQPPRPTTFFGPEGTANEAAVAVSQLAIGAIVEGVLLQSKTLFADW